MKVDILIDKIKVDKSTEDLFDSICLMEKRIQSDGIEQFFEQKISKKGKTYKVLKNDFIIDLIKNVLKNEAFNKSLSKILRYYREYKDLRNFPKTLTYDFQLVNIGLELGFYVISRFSKDLSISTIEFIGKVFYSILKEVEKDMMYEFSFDDILKILENAVFYNEFAFHKNTLHR